MAATNADPIAINASGGVPAFSANEFRLGLGVAIMYDGRRVGGRKGVRPGADQLLVSYANPTLTIQPGICVLDPGLTSVQGSYLVAIPTTDTHTVSAADATNPRKDIVICRVYDHDEDASGNRFARTEYLVGTPAASPAEPATPGSAIKLALLDVPSVGGGGLGSAVVTDTRPFTVAPGGILPVRVAGDIAAGTEGRYRDRLDTNLMERDSGSVWETVADPALFKAWTSYSPAWSSSGTAPALGNGTLVGRHRKLGRTVDVLIRLTWGSTTTGGTGEWRFTLPFAPVDEQILHAMCYDTSAALPVPAMARLVTGSPHITRIGAHTAAGVGTWLDFDGPFAWATGDQVLVEGTYEAAS